MTLRLISASVGKGGRNARPDVLAVQRAINGLIGRLAPLAPLAEDGIIGPASIAAIEEFQRRVVSLSRPDGRIDPGGKTERTIRDLLVPPQPVGDGSKPKWFKIAENEIGVKELPGLEANNPRILEYIASFPYLAKIPYTVLNPKTGTRYKTSFRLTDVDETAWCACFVNWCLKEADKNTDGMNARAERWASYGEPLPSGAPKIGAITVVKRKAPVAGMTSSGNHVGFYAGGPANAPVLLGGNQGNRVSKKSFAGWQILAYRWPAY